MTRTVTINTVGIQTWVISDLAPGTWYFGVATINASGVDSGISSTLVKTI
jgi:hypothetical protein